MMSHRPKTKKIIPKKEAVDWDAILFDGLDFWNDPNRWIGIDPHKEMFWMRETNELSSNV